MKLGPKINHSKRHIWSFRFSSRKSQSLQKLALKIATHFAIQSHSKNLTRLTNFNSLVIIKSILPQHSQKPYPLSIFFSKHVSGWCQKETLALHHFQMPTNWILKVLGKQMSVYSCKSPQENFCSRDVRSFYLVQK